MIQFSSSAFPAQCALAANSKYWVSVVLQLLSYRASRLQQRPCRAAQVKVSELVEGLQLVHAGFFTEASFGQHLAAFQEYTLGITATFKSSHEGA